MSMHWENDNTGGCATLSRDRAEPKRKPRLVLAGKLPFTVRVADHFRRQGWHVHTVAPGRELYRAVRSHKASAVVLDAAMGEESGFLVCAKLLRCQPRLPVLLVGAKRTENAARFAQFIGATAFLCDDDAPHSVLGAIGCVLRMAA